MSDPFAQGLPRPVVLRLLAGPGRFTKADHKLYQTTDHWQAVRLASLAYWGRRCEDCGMPGSQVHHTREGYRNLFREDVARHLRVLCGTHHRRRHGK